MNKSEKFSRFYEALPRTVEESEIEYENGRFLSPVFREFEFDGRVYKLVIDPAVILDENLVGKHYLPTSREWTVESALIYLADEENPNFYPDRSLLIFRLKQLSRVLARTFKTHGLTDEELKLSLQILAGLNFEVSGGEGVVSFHPIEVLERVESEGEPLYGLKLSNILLGTDPVLDRAFGD